MICGMLAAIAACSSPPPPPAPTVVEVKLTAAAGVNATQSGQAAPVVVRIYQLASAAAFEGGEFFRIYNTDAATLATDLLKKDEYLLAPGETRAVTLTPPEQAHVIGVFAAYRDFRTATWRATAAIPPHQTTNLTIVAGPSGITLNSAPESRARP